MRQLVAASLAAVLGGALLAAPASAKPKPDDTADDEEEPEEDAPPPRKKARPGDDENDRRARKKKPQNESADDGDERPVKKKAPAEDDGDDEHPARKRAPADDEADNEDFKKQDLTGHDLGTTKKENVFERDRFWVDKTDSGKTSRGTLVQGSLTSTSFAYHEAGGTLVPPVVMGDPVPSASQFDRMFTDLRLQTDFRHIAASAWEARVDVRGRVVATPDTITRGWTPANPAKTQSGLLGADELEVKELWLVRNGARSDVFLGRQFIPDLAGVKIDGLRIDYASSAKWTLLGFGGLYPIRGSRSIMDDYTPLQSNPAPDGKRSSAGRFTGAGGFGAAYRTLDAYGAFGGVVLAPLSSESPRVFGTSTGYWRYGTQLDFYHLAVIDLVGSNAVNAGITNLSLGLNYKPDPRLRANLSAHRVDTETLNVQAQAFLANPDPNVSTVQNEAYLTRIATNEGRASLSAGLGSLQRFEITAAVTYRRRGEVELLAPPPATAPVARLSPAQSIEVYGAITDRRSVADLRLGVDGSRIFGAGSGATYQRTQSTALRAFAAHDLDDGRGEWEAEAAYSTSQDDSAGMTCGEIASCYGASKSSILSLGGNVYYRINRDWFVMGSVFLNRSEITHVDAAGPTADPTVTGISGFARIAYRF